MQNRKIDKKAQIRIKQEVGCKKGCLTHQLNKVTRNATSHPYQASQKALSSIEKNKSFIAQNLLNHFNQPKIILFGQNILLTNQSLECKTIFHTFVKQFEWKDSKLYPLTFRKYVKQSGISLGSFKNLWILLGNRFNQLKQQVEFILSYKIQFIQMKQPHTSCNTKDLKELRRRKSEGCYLFTKINQCNRVYWFGWILHTFYYAQELQLIYFGYIQYQLTLLTQAINYIKIYVH